MVNTLVFTLVGRDQLSKVFEAAGRSSEQAGRKMGAAGKVAAGGLGLLLAGGAAAAAGIGAAVKAAIPFDKTIRQVGAISGASGADLKSLSALAIQMGKDTVFGAGDAAAAMLELSKGGITPAQIKAGVLAGTLTLATAGSLEMGDAATYLSNALNTFGLKAKDSNTVVAALAGGANASSASVESLGLALGQVGPGAKLAGMSIQETVAVLAAFDNAGVKGSDAGTSLKTMLMKLVPTTKLATNTMHDLGLKFTDAKGAFLPMRDIAEQLHEKLAGLSASQKQAALTAIFGSDAYRAAAIMSELGAKGVDKYTTATSDLNAAQALANVGVEGASGAWEQLKGSVETLAIEQGQKLLPAFTAVALFANNTLVPAVGGLIDEFGNFVGFVRSDVVPELVSFAGWVNTNVIPVLTTLGQGALKQVSAAVATVGGAIKEHEPEIRQLGASALALGGWLATNLQPPIEWLGSNGIPMLGGAIAGIIGVFGTVTGVIQDHTTTAEILAGLIVAVFIPGWIALGVAAVASGISQAAAWAANSVAGIAGAISHSASVVTTVAGWVAMGAAAIASGAETALIWGLYASEAIAGAAAHVGAALAVVGGWISMAAVATSNAIILAAAWFIGLGPVAWAIAILILLGLGFVALWKKSETFRDIMTAVWVSVKDATKTAVKFVVDKFLEFAGGILDAVTLAFGWVPKLGDKLKGAQDDFKKFRDDVNNKLGGINDKKVQVTAELKSWGTPELLAAAHGRWMGGPVVGPGGGTDDRAGLFALSNNEHIWTAAEVAAAGGHDKVASLRAAVLAGQVTGLKDGGPAVRQGVHVAPKLPTGKEVSTASGNVSSIMQFIGLSMAKKLQANLEKSGGPALGALAWAKTQVGKPYGWGAVGPAAYDCSGLVSAVINKAFGRNPHTRLGATGSMPWSNFASGAGRVMVGWFTGNPGHTAMTIMGTNVESAGGVGVRVGGKARGASNGLFNHRMHVKGLAKGGPAEGFAGDAPFDLLHNRKLREALGFKVFDDGGWLMPGEFGYNGTRKPEPVFNTDKMGAPGIDYEKLADVLVKAIREGRPVNVAQNFPAAADPMAAANAGAQRLVSLLGDI